MDFYSESFFLGFLIRNFLKTSAFFFFQVTQCFSFRDSWLEVKDLLNRLLNTITVPNLVSRHQIIVLNAINNSPSIVVDFLADLIARNIEQLETELATSHIAIPIAFARRITDSQCCDSIAKVNMFCFFFEYENRFYFMD